MDDPALLAYSFGKLCNSFGDQDVTKGTCTQVPAMWSRLTLEHGYGDFLVSGNCSALQLKAPLARNARMV